MTVTDYKAEYQKVIDWYNAYLRSYAAEMERWERECPAEESEADAPVIVKESE
jgi:hypothetical protein